MEKARMVVVLLWVETPPEKKGSLIKIEVTDEFKYFTIAKRDTAEVNEYRRRSRSKGRGRQIMVSPELIDKLAAHYAMKAGVALFGDLASEVEDVLLKYRVIAYN